MSILNALQIEIPSLRELFGVKDDKGLRSVLDGVVLDGVVAQQK